MDAAERAAMTRAAGRAVVRVTRAVGDTHAAVVDVVRLSLTPLGPSGQLPVEASAGLARFSYAAVSGIATAVSGMGGPVAAATTPSRAPAASDTPGAAAWLAALSAAFGDRMRRDASLRALTVPMAVREGGAVVVAGMTTPAGVMQTDQDTPLIDDSGRARRSSMAHRGHQPTLVVFVHGLGGHEAQWSAEYLSAARDNASTPMAVRYTTGQPIAESGAELAGLLDELVEVWPVPVERIVLVGHSMGGLVVRAALAHEGPWRTVVSDAVTLGTPHAGAGLERSARRALAVGSAIPVTAPLAALGDERSAGIKDLAFGDVAQPAPDVAWHVVAGVVRQPALRRLGDGLVTVDSAFGIPDAAIAGRLRIDDANHLDLLDHPAVADLLADVLAGPGAATG